MGTMNSLEIMDLFGTVGDGSYVKVGKKEELRLYSYQSEGGIRYGQFVSKNACGIKHRN